MEKKVKEISFRIVEEFVSKEGYACRIKLVKSTFFQFYCGYVQLPTNHPDFAKTYREIDSEIDVHGGLTYGEDGLFGFDCNHSGDTITEWNVARVRQECEALAAIFKLREV